MHSWEKNVGYSQGKGPSQIAGPVANCEAGKSNFK